jgi:hypothetical protein
MSDKNDRMKATHLRFARSATRHRVSKESILHVIIHCGLHFDEPPPASDAGVADPRLLFLGDDADGCPLEVIVVESSDAELVVIHAMPLRNKYKQQYEEAKTWRL